MKQEKHEYDLNVTFIIAFPNILQLKIFITSFFQELLCSVKSHTILT